MAGGLWRSLDHEDAARFAFLLATPSSWPPARTLTPFAIYCLVFGALSMFRFL